jgi:hypothetical protein
VQEWHLQKRDHPELVAARFLLKPGREYEQAVKAFEPYDVIKKKRKRTRTHGPLAEH